MMAADVTSLMRFFDGEDANGSGKSTAEMMTRDLLGGCSSDIVSSSSLESKELDLDLQVPCGWEKRLDLKSGKVYLQRCNSSSSSSSPSSSQSSTIASKSQDLINIPRKPKQTLNLFDDTSSLSDLKLISSSSSIYQSVCTLDKVRFALDRAEKETHVRKRSISLISNKSSTSQRSNSSSSSSIKVDNNDEDRFMSFATGCPSCLMYVLISSFDPKCPRCNSNVPLTVAMKKPKIDLNMAI